MNVQELIIITMVKESPGLTSSLLYETDVDLHNKPVIMTNLHEIYKSQTVGCMIVTFLLLYMYINVMFYAQHSPLPE